MEAKRTGRVGHPRWSEAAPIVVHLAATFAFTFPAMLYIREGLFGAPRDDKYQFIWNFWWVDRALLELGRLPGYTDLQYHPTGVSLALHDMTYFWSMLSVPVQLFASPATALNIFLIASLILNGLAFHRLAMGVTGSRPAALAGSLVFAYCPYLVGRFRVSHIQYVAVFFVPLFLLCLWRHQRDPRHRHLAWAGLFAGLQSLVSFYYGIALGGLFIAYLVYFLLQNRRQWRSPGYWRRTGLGFASTAVVAAALAAPAIAPGLLELRAGDFERSTQYTGYAHLEGSSADLVSYALPDFTIAPWIGWRISTGALEHAATRMKSLGGNGSEKAVYPGWLSIAACVAALWCPSVRRRAWPWVGLAAAAAVLTLGPTLYIDGTPHLRGWLPARWIPAIPLVGIIRGTTRFATFVTLGSGMAVALCIAAIEKRHGVRMAVKVAAACALVTILEFLPQPHPVFTRDTWISPFYAQMADDDERYTILNVPVDYHGARGGGAIYQYAQTVHHKPMVGGYVSREPRYVFDTVDGSPFLQAIRHRRYEANPRLTLGQAGIDDMPHQLTTLGIRYVIVHRGELRTPGEWRRVNSWLARGPLQRVHDDERIRVYEVLERTPAP